MMDIAITANKIDILGIGVLPKLDRYEITFESEGDLNLFTFRTCSREQTYQGKKYGLDKRKITIIYIPNEIERNNVCPADIGAFSVSGRHSWGWLSFENDFNKLPATLICGKSTKEANGISACQGRVGLVQMIKFNDPVMVVTQPSCTSIFSENNNLIGKIFEIKLSKGICTYSFMDIASRKVHTLNTYGYDDILIRI